MMHVNLRRYVDVDACCDHHTGAAAQVHAGLGHGARRRRRRRRVSISAVSSKALGRLTWLTWGGAGRAVAVSRWSGCSRAS
jgi:hypothetical protein